MSSLLEGLEKENQDCHDPSMDQPHYLSTSAKSHLALPPMPTPIADSPPIRTPTIYTFTSSSTTPTRVPPRTHPIPHQLDPSSYTTFVFPNMNSSPNPLISKTTPPILLTPNMSFSHTHLTPNIISPFPQNPDTNLQLPLTLNPSSSSHCTTPKLTPAPNPMTLTAPPSGYSTDRGLSYPPLNSTPGHCKRTRISTMLQEACLPLPMLQQLCTIVAGANAIRALGTLVFVVVVYLKAELEGQDLHVYLSEWMFNAGLFNHIQLEWMTKQAPWSLASFFPAMAILLATSATITMAASLLLLHAVSNQRCGLMVPFLVAQTAEMLLWSVVDLTMVALNWLVDSGPHSATSNMIITPLSGIRITNDAGDGINPGIKAMMLFAPVLVILGAMPVYVIWTYHERLLYHQEVVKTRASSSRSGSRVGPFYLDFSSVASFSTTDLVGLRL